MHIVLPHVQIAFLKFTNCDNQALVGSNCCCSCSFELEIIKIGQSSHKMYSNNIVNFQEAMIILNACTRQVWKLIECTMYTNTHRHRHTPEQTYMHIYHIYCLLGFVCDHLSSFAIPFSPPPFFKVLCTNRWLFQPAKIATNFTTDWTLSVALAHINAIMQSNRSDMFAHTAFKTSKWETVFRIFHSWCGDFVDLVLVLVRPLRTDSL